MELAALFSTKTWEETGVLKEGSIKIPCDECHKPCISHCHYQAVTKLGWDMKTCAEGHLLGNR